MADYALVSFEDVDDLQDYADEAKEMETQGIKPDVAPPSIPGCYYWAFHRGALPATSFPVGPFDSLELAADACRQRYGQAIEIN